MKIEIYTDGACSGNPGRGGYGIVMKVRELNYEKRFAAGYKHTTNNRMELLAVIVALEKLKEPENDVHVFTDSKYVAEAVNKNWIEAWVKRSFKNVKNEDLWKRFIPLMKKHRVKFHWIKGHAGHLENEICDQLAVFAAQQPNLLEDEGFTSPKKDGLF